MIKFPRISSEDFKNSVFILKTVLKDKSTLNEKTCQYGELFKEEILNAVNDLEHTTSISKLSIENPKEATSGITSLEIIQMAVDGYKKIFSDKEATAATKQQAVKFLREAARELDDLKNLQAESEKFKALEQFLKEFLTQLLDETKTLDKKTIATEFMNRLGELINV